MNPLLSALVQAGLMTKEDADRLERQLDSQLAREFAEAELLRAFQVGLSGQRDRLVDAVRATDGLFPLAQQDRLWGGENERLWNSVRGTLLDVASERAVLATIAGAGGLPIGEETWRLVNQNVLAWVDDYYLDADGAAFGSIPNLNLTSRTQFAQAFRDWQLGELATAGAQDGLPQLIRALEPTFGASRAELIGITENTRIFAESELHAARANPFIEFLLWETARDERVCPICWPRQGLIVDKQSDGFSVATDSIIGFPPGHGRCRCGISSLTGPAADALRTEGIVRNV